MSLTGSPPRRRSPVEGGYVRGEETRGRIVAAALRVFADEGFARASTRRIAAEAGVNPPALQYYFDSKEGLHRACAERIIADVAAQLEPVLAAGRRVLPDGDADAALDALCDLVDAVADLTLAREETPVWRRFVARAQDEDAGGAYPRIKEAVGAPIQALARALVARATGAWEEDEAVRLRAHLVMTQLSTFHAQREQAIGAVGWTHLGDPHVAAIKRIVRQHTRASLLAARTPTA